MRRTVRSPPCKHCGCDSFSPNAFRVNFCSNCLHAHGPVGEPYVGGKLKPVTPVVSPSAKFSRTLTELRETERSYVDDLTILVEEFRYPLEELAKSKKLGSVVSSKVVSEIFSNVESILTLHVTTVTPAVCDLPVEELAQGFIRITKWFALYNEYVKAHDRSTRTVFEISKNKRVAELLHRVSHQPRCRNLHIEALLIKPLQRLCKYELFFRDLERHAGSQEVTEQFASARESLHAVISDMNGMVKRVENQAHIFDIQSKLRGLENCLAAANRFHVTTVSNFAAAKIYSFRSRKWSNGTMVIVLSDIVLLVDKDRGLWERVVCLLASWWSLLISIFWSVLGKSFFRGLRRRVKFLRKRSRKVVVTKPFISDSDALIFRGQLSLLDLALKKGANDEDSVFICTGYGTNGRISLSFEKRGLRDDLFDLLSDLAFKCHKSAVSFSSIDPFQAVVFSVEDRRRQLEQIVLRDITVIEREISSPDVDDVRKVRRIRSILERDRTRVSEFLGICRDHLLLPLSTEEKLALEFAVNMWSEFMIPLKATIGGCDDRSYLANKLAYLRGQVE